jgi:hypothetical protein
MRCNFIGEGPVVNVVTRCSATGKTLLNHNTKIERLTSHFISRLAESLHETDDVENEYGNTMPRTKSYTVSHL